MRELIKRLKAAEGADRGLDREIGLYLDGWLATVDDFGDALMVDGDRYPDHPGAEYPSFTGSLDVALRLAERVLDRRGPININVCLAGSAQVLIYPDDPCGLHVQALAPTPALALCVAILIARSTAV